MSAKPQIYPSPGKDNLDFITVDTDCGRAVRALDWSATPLGPPGQWSQALRTMTQFVLANRFPQLLWWGPEYVCIYNDAYTPILGSKHPRAMGRLDPVSVDLVAGPGRHLGSPPFLGLRRSGATLSTGVRIPSRMSRSGRAL